MNVPVVARRTFEELKNQAVFVKIVHFVVERLMKITNTYKRADFIHNLVDEYNAEVFSHPLVMQLSPCKRGCTACCHTQVSVTNDEAELLVKRIKSGVNIDRERLKIQMEAGANGDAYFNIPYDDRKCIFLDDQGACAVYEDRPSVCRTNVVLGSPEQCDTSKAILPTRLVRTLNSDMVIYGSFFCAKSSGTLPYMVGKHLLED
jgi:Fe-S-cluster containining protein